MMNMNLNFYYAFLYHDPIITLIEFHIMYNNFTSADGLVIL